MNQELTKRTEHLPNTVEGLHKFILVNREMLQAHMAKLRAIDKVNLARSARDAALLDAQHLGEVVLRAEAKLGEILKAIPKKPVSDGSSKGTFGGSKPSLPEGISKKQSHHAQALASHPQAIDQAIEQAKQKEEVPTRAAVLRVIHRETHPPKPRELKPPRPKNIPCPELGIRTIEFDSAFRTFTLEILKARDNNWKTVSKEVVLQCLKSLESIVYEKVNKKSKEV